MSSKSSHSGEIRSGFSGKMMVGAIIIGLVFLTIILVYPRIFSPSNIGVNTGPAPLTTAPATAQPGVTH